MARQAIRVCDAIGIDSLEGITDAWAHPRTHREIFAIRSLGYQGPVLVATRYHVELRPLSAVVKTGQEQGDAAAAMLLKAMRGTPVSQLPVERNYRGRRLIDVTTLNKKATRPRPIVLRGATLAGARQKND